jgi:DNA polymerase
MIENVLGLSRSQVYIANVVKCRPPGNRKPQNDETDICKTFLFRQIAAIRPKLLLVLGGTALEAVLHRTGILKERGKEGDFRGIPAIPTLHPAYLLRQPGDKRLVFDDLKLARARYAALGGRVRTP